MNVKCKNLLGRTGVCCEIRNCHGSESAVNIILLCAAVSRTGTKVSEEVLP